jgi:valyl-tRNA synthetase
MSTYFLGDIPFKTVYLHGIVRDEQGRKISKSLGNNIDPVDMAKKYGADAVRMSLIIGTGPGNDSKLGENKIKGYKNFSNKLWNITRYVLSSTEKFDYSKKPALTDADKATIENFDKILADVTVDMDNFRFYLAGEKMYAYVWHEFAEK